MRERRQYGECCRDVKLKIATVFQVLGYMLGDMFIKGTLENAASEAGAQWVVYKCYIYFTHS